MKYKLWGSLHSLDMHQTGAFLWWYWHVGLKQTADSPCSIRGALSHFHCLFWWQTSCVKSTGMEQGSCGFWHCATREQREGPCSNLCCNSSKHISRHPLHSALLRSHSPVPQLSQHLWHPSWSERINMSNEIEQDDTEHLDLSPFSFQALVPLVH